MSGVSGGRDLTSPTFCTGSGREPVSRLQRSVVTSSAKAGPAWQHPCIDRTGMPQQRHCGRWEVEYVTVLPSVCLFSTHYSPACLWVLGFASNGMYGAV